MTARAILAQDFLATAGWGSARRVTLAGDASNRSYDRLHSDDQTAVLMNAPPERGEDVRPFCAIADHLRAQGLSAPRILARDETHGFLLLEDLGDDLLARVVMRDMALEQPCYATAVDALVVLHAAPLPKAIDPYDATTMAGLAGLAYDKYGVPFGTTDPAAGRQMVEQLEELLNDHAAPAQVLLLRDYHAENLLWLPDRNGAARIGLLDFQDAMAGHPAYDLVSLLQDVRRDVPEKLEEAMIARYLTQTGLPAEPFRKAYAVMGAQRHLRVLGVFARLCTEYGKPGYLAFMPRVWALLNRCLDDPALAPVADRLRRDLPPPSANLLQDLRDRCPSR